MGKKATIYLTVSPHQGKSAINGSKNIEEYIRKEFKRFNDDGIKGQAIPMIMVMHIASILKVKSEFKILDNGDFQYSWTDKKKKLKELFIY